MDKQREQFEQWFQGEQGKPYDGMYMFAWAAWQARQPEIDALKAEIKAITNEWGVCIELWRETGKEIAALKAENERLRKDAERLNAIERGGIELRMQYEREEEDLFLVFKINGFPNDLEYFEIGRGVTVREAIDAATKEAK